MAATWNRKFELSSSSCGCDHNLHGEYIGYISQLMIRIQFGMARVMANEGCGCCIAAHTAAMKDSTSVGGPPKAPSPLLMYVVAAEGCLLHGGCGGSRCNILTPLLAMTRAMANWMCIIGCDTYPMYSPWMMGSQPDMERYGSTL